MNLAKALTASAIALTIASGAAMAQVNSPVGQNRAEGQLSPEQAEEVARPAAKAPSTTAGTPTGYVAENSGLAPDGAVDNPAAENPINEKLKDQAGQ